MNIAHRQFPTHRSRRLRATPELRTLVREVSVGTNDLIYPVFVRAHPGSVRSPIASMPGIYQLSLDELLREADTASELGIPGLLLFGVPETKDELGSGAYIENGIIQQAAKLLKAKFPNLLLFGDVCLCEYTSHGHCGVVENGNVLNDDTLTLLSKTAVSQAAAGIDVVAPSDMMDGRVGAIRTALDDAKMHQVPILSYAVKYASGYYGPFREAAGSTPKFGDRSTYQMDPGNIKEALVEAMQDIAEGADMLMVKPALAYLDIIRDVSTSVDVPVAAYNVSGEYSMVKAAAANGWIDEKRVVMETLNSIKRAGASFIFTYHALDAATWFNGKR